MTNRAEPEDPQGPDAKVSAEPALALVFISYASQDVTVADAVVEALERRGLTCWIAPRDVTPGEFYAGSIVRAIDAAKAVVLILSQNSGASPHVVREVERAASKRHPVVSLRIDRAPLPADLEYFLNTSQWLDASDGEPARVLSKLVAAVRVAIDKSQTSEPAIEGTCVRPPHSAGRGWSARRKAILAASVVMMAIVGFSAYRSWRSAHQAAALSTATAPPNIPVAPVIPEKSVAVLPFVDMSEKKDQEYFSDGMSEELIDMLTRIPDLRVPARTSSFYFKGKQASISDIATALGVAYVLEGSVRKSGKTLRVTTQLVRVDSGYHLWSATYDRQLDDVFKVQDDIASAVVNALKTSLIGRALPESAGTQNVEAYNLYLQARSIYIRANTRSEYEKVLEYLRKAIDADPQFAKAWALLSTALAVQGEEKYVPLTQAIAEARRAAFRALELNPRLSDAHTALARIFIGDLDISRGEVQLQEALRLDPNGSLALAWAAILAAHKGEFDKAINLVQRSIDSDPVNPTRYGNLAAILYYAGKYREALAASRKYDDLRPGARNSGIMAGFISLATGDPATALSQIEASPELATCGCRVLALDALGRRPEADVALANLERNHADDSANAIAQVYANRGDLDQAFKWFDRAYRQHEDGVMWTKVDPLLKNVQADPRFETLLNKLGLAGAGTG
jgi:TolB-like protein